MSATSELLISIKADIANASRGLTTLTKELTAVNTTAKGMSTGGTGLAQTEASLLSIGKAGTVASGGLTAVMKSGAGMALGFAGVTTAAAGIYMLGQTAADAVDKAKGFEQQMANVGAVSGSSKAEIAAFSDAAMRLGPTWGMGATTVGQGMEELNKAGISMADITGGATEGAITLAKAGGVDMATAAMVGANAINLFNMRGSDMTHVANMAAGAANATVISVQDYAAAFQQASAAAAMANQTFDSTTVAIAMMGQAGIKNSDAGTSLKQMFLSLAPTTKTARDEMERLGLIVNGQNQFYDAATGKAKSYRDIAQLLQDSLKGLNSEQQTTALQLIFGSDAYRAAAVAATAGARGVDEMMAAIQKTSAAEVAKARLDTFSGSMDKLGAEWENFNIRTGGGALPGFRWLADVAAAGLHGANTQPELFNQLATGGTPQGAMIGGWDSLRQIWELTGTAADTLGRRLAELRGEIAPYPSEAVAAATAEQQHYVALTALPDRLEAAARSTWNLQVAQTALPDTINNATGAIQHQKDVLGEQIARASAPGVGLMPDQLAAQLQVPVMEKVAAAKVKLEQDAANEAAAAQKKAIADVLTAQKKAAADAVQALKDSYNEAKQALQEFARTPLTGETAMSDKAFGLDVAIAQDEKRLLELQGTRGAGREITATTKHLEDLKKQRDLLSKEQFLTFEPDRRILNRMANPVTEIAPDAAKAAILELLGQMPGLAAAAGEKSLNVGGVTVQLNGVTGENLVEKSQTAAEVILNAIRNARNSGTRYQGAASPQLSGGG